MNTTPSLRGLARLTRGAFSITVVGLGVSYLANTFLARAMGPQGYGAYAFATSWAVLLAVPSTVGLPPSLLQLLPAFWARREMESYRGLLRFAWLLVLALGVTVAAAATFVAAAVGAAGEVLIAMAAIPLLALTDLQGAVSRTLGGVFWATAPKGLLRFAILSILALGWWGLGHPLDAVSTVTMFVVASAAIALVQGSRVFRGLPGGAWRGARVLRPGPWLAVAFPLLLTTAISIVFARTDTLMLGLLGDNTQVGLYFAAARLAALVALSQAAANTVGATLLSQSHADEDRTEFARTARRMLHLAFWPALGFTVMLYAFGAPILGLFGPEFRHANTFLPILLVGQLMNVSVGPAALALNMTGNQGVTAWVSVTTALANVVLNLVLIPRFGATGAALSTALTMGCWNALLAIVAWRRLGVNTTVFSRFWRYR